MRKRERSLRSTLLRVMIALSAAVLVILAAVVLLSTWLVQREILVRQRLLVEALARQGDQYLDETERLMQTVSEVIVDLPSAHQTAVLARARATYSRFAAFYLLDHEGKVLVEQTDMLSLVGLDMSGEQSFLCARESGQTCFSDPFISPTLGQVAVTGAVPIDKEGQFWGVLVGELDLALLQGTIEQIDVGEGGISFIVDQRGTLIAHPNQVWVQERVNVGNLSLVKRGMRASAAFDVFYDDSQDAWLIGSVSTMGRGWIVVTTQPVLVAARPLLLLAVVSILALGGSFALFVWTQVYSLRQITGPVLGLAQRVSALSEAQYEALPVEQMGEFGEIVSLGHSFNRMVEAVQERDRSVAERAESLRAANEALEIELYERQRAEDLVLAQRDLALAIGAATTLEDTMRLCVEAALRITGMDAGGVYLLDELRGSLDLVFWEGLSSEFVEAVSHIPVDSPRGRLMMMGKPLYANYQDPDMPLSDVERREDLHLVAALPVLYEGHVIACLNIASQSVDEIPEPARNAIEALAAQLGSVVARARAEATLREQDRLAAIGRLAGGIAHDFNNLLTAILGYMELVLVRVRSQDPIYADLVEVKESAQRAAALVGQLLAFSRKQVLQPKVLDLNAVIGNMENMMRRLIGEDIELGVELAPRLGRVMADPGQIEQVILNLVVNARDAMPLGGRLSVSTAMVTLGDAYAQLHADVEPGSYIMLTVSDTGTGMSDEVKAHIFEPFFTTKETSKGTGLGLATVHGVVKQSGGHVEVQSEMGKGSTFRVYLPHTEGVEDVSRDDGPSVARPRGTETILLVEDEEMVRRLALRILEQQGYTVFAASHPEDAVLFSDEHAETIDLLVTDVVMPGMGGRDLAERIVASRPGIKVLYVSGYTDDAISQHGVSDSVADLLQKPFTPSILAQKVREVLDASRGE
jgi:signal transduction histidine kinase/ActR/RegA family two-component response regulator